jgi:hypothetical protein
MTTPLKISLYNDIRPQTTGLFTSRFVDICQLFQDAILDFCRKFFSATVLLLLGGKKLLARGPREGKKS